jgi:hypothetical protein
MRSTDLRSIVLVVPWLVACTQVGDEAAPLAGEDHRSASESSPVMTSAQAAAEFAKDAVNWMTTYEDANDMITLGGSQGSGSIAIRNGMRNSIH